MYTKLVQIMWLLALLYEMSDDDWDHVTLCMGCVSLLWLVRMTQACQEVLILNIAVVSKSRWSKISAVVIKLSSYLKYPH